MSLTAFQYVYSINKLFLRNYVIESIVCGDTYAAAVTTLTPCLLVNETFRIININHMCCIDIMQKSQVL